MGALSDRYGRRTVLMACSALFAALTVPLFAILGSAGLVTVFAVWAIFGILLSMNGGTLPTFLCELFPTRVRFSGFALSFNAANALFGGTAPLDRRDLADRRHRLEARPGLLPRRRRPRDPRGDRGEQRRPRRLRPRGRVTVSPGGPPPGSPRTPRSTPMTNAYETGRLNLPFVGIATFGKRP